MTEISSDQIRYLCTLARLKIDPGEIERLRRELARILAYMRVLDSVDTAGMEPLVHAVDRPTDLREDRVRPGVSAAQALRGAADREGDCFAVPAVIPWIDPDRP